MPKDLATSEPNLDAIRAYRLERLRAELAARDYAGAILYDPLNIRYATDTSNMQVWCMHNDVRYAYVATEGPVVIFEFHGSEHLSNWTPYVSDVAHAAGWLYMMADIHTPERVERWADELASVIHGSSGGNRRIAVDKVNWAGADALRARGFELFDGQECAERARAIKSSDEIAAMRIAIAAAESGMAKMREATVPGATENEIWAWLHHENIRLGGEWIETRLLSSGPRTNPWMQECGPRALEKGDMLSFDTDLVGPYGYCADISRSWVCDARPSDEQKRIYAMARAQIAHNMALLKAGLSFREFNERSFQLPDEFRAQRYPVVTHGVGLCDEWPVTVYAEDAERAGYEGVFEENMVICVESYVGAVGGREGIKLEEQVRITADGCEVLSSYPFEDDMS